MASRRNSSTTREVSSAAAANANAIEIKGSKVEYVLARDTKDFKERVDLEGIGEAEKVAKRIVVVSQFPKAGTQIPAGTPVTISVMYKDMIDVGKLKGMTEEFTTKYKDDKIKKVIDDIESNNKAKEIITKEKEYKDLSTAEKNTMKKYAKDQGILTDEASAEKVENVYKDLKFIYSF